MASELGVQTIQHTNGTDAMTIDSNGVASRSVVPAWFLAFGTSTDSRSAATEAVVSNFAVQSDSGYNNTYIQGGCSVSGGIVTVPKTGLYYVHGCCRFDSLDSGQWGRIGISINSQTLVTSANSYQTLRYSPSNLAAVNGETYLGLNVSAILKVDANDTFEIRAETNSDTSWSISQYESHFTGYFIG